MICAFYLFTKFMPWLVKLRWISTSKPGICWRNPTQIGSSLNSFTKLANILQHCGHAGNIPALNIIFDFLTTKLWPLGRNLFSIEIVDDHRVTKLFPAHRVVEVPVHHISCQKLLKKQGRKSSRVWGVWERVCPRVRPVNDWMSEWDPFWVINRDSPKAGRGLPKVQTQHICMN